MSELVDPPHTADSYVEVRTNGGGDVTLDTLQGWWENSCVRPGMVRVKRNEVFIKHRPKGGPIEVSSNREVRWSIYKGIVQSNGRVISWSPGDITWLYIGILPDEYDAEKDQGRWRYDAFLGKGSSGCAYSVEDMRRSNGHESPPRKLAVKVLRSFSDSAKKPNHQDVFKLHQEFQWSRLRLHNRSHKQYNLERGRLIVEYLEDHTGFPSDKTVTMLTEDVVSWLKDAKNIPPQPYVVMEHAGSVMWDVLTKRELRFTLEEKGKIIQQIAMALDYMGKFNLRHRDLRLHNICVSGSGGDCTIKVLDLGRVADKTKPEVFAFSPRDEAHWKLRDWIPWEEWVIEGTPKEKNGHMVSGNPFDVFSMGVILLYICVGQSETRHILEKSRQGKHQLAPERAKKMVLEGDFVLRMVSNDPAERPSPVEVLNAFANKRRKLN